MTQPADLVDTRPEAKYPTQVWLMDINFLLRCGLYERIFLGSVLLWEGVIAVKMLSANR